MKKSEKYKKIRRKFWIFSGINGGLLLLFFMFLTLAGYRSGFSIDLTEQKLFTLSEASLNTLQELDEPVRIAAVYASGREEPMVKALLEQYEKHSPYLSVEYIDAEKEPSSLAAYDLGDVVAVYNGSLIVEGANRTKIIRSDDLFSYTSGGNFFYGEREITGAIKYVSAEKLPVVYFTTGHGEINAGSYLTEAAAALNRNAYEVKSLVLLQEGIPEDADILILASPSEDLTDAEIEDLEAFMGKGGKVMVTVDPLLTSNEPVLKKLNAFVNQYGIDISNNYVVEENSGYYLTDNPMYLIPRYSSHEITLPIGNEEKMVILPLARGLGMVDYDEKTTNLEVLLQTSEKAWARNNMENTSAVRTGDDIEGPIPLGFAAQKSNLETREISSRLVVFGDSNFMTDGNFDMQANAQLFMNSVDWLLGGRDTDTIGEKMINSEKLLVRNEDFMKLAVICCAVLPAISFGCAIMLWRFRRNG